MEVEIFFVSICGQLSQMNPQMKKDPYVVQLKWILNSWLCADVLL